DWPGVGREFNRYRRAQTAREQLRGEPIPHRSQVAESVSPHRLSGSESYERLRRAAIVLPVILVFGPDAFEFDRQTGVPVARALCLFDTWKIRHQIAVRRRASQGDDSAHCEFVGSFFEPP